jgi:hypothetical protein
MKDKAIAVGREHKRDIEGHCIVKRLLHAVPHTVVVVLGLNDGDRDIGLVIKDVIGPLGLATGNELSPNDDAALGEGDLLADLHHPVPPRALHCGAYELGADIALAQVFLVHKVISVALGLTYLRSEDLIFRLAPWRMWSTSTRFCFSKTWYITR